MPAQRNAAPTTPLCAQVTPAGRLVESGASIELTASAAELAAWKSSRSALLARLRDRGMVCKDWRQCHRMAYDGAAGSASAAYQAPVHMAEPWLDAKWLYTPQMFDQARHARMHLAGLAWLDDSVGAVLRSLDETGLAASTLTVYTADHGASFLGKGHLYEAGVRVPLIVRWPAGGVPAGARHAAPLALLDLFPTLLNAAELPAAAASGHGRCFLDAVRPAVGASSPALVTERPIFLETGYARGVVLRPWKLIVVNDLEGRCRRDESSLGLCRNLHGEAIDRRQCNFTAHGGSLSRAGVCNMTYDAVARHRSFCDRRQLYHLPSDPLEQVNVASLYPAKFAELLDLVLQHVGRVEATNPAVARSDAYGSSAAARAKHPCARDGATA